MARHLSTISRLLLVVAIGWAAGNVTAQSPSLAAHYRLDELGGAACFDSTCNALDGAYTAGTTTGQAGAAGGTGSSVTFDHLAMGSVDIADGTPLTGMSSDLTVTAWIWPRSVGAGLMRILANDDGAWSCGMYTGGLLFTTRFIRDYYQGTPIPLGAWSHVAFVFDSAFDVTFYVDGVNVGMVTGTAPAGPPNSTWFLGHLNPTTEFWDGRLDDVQVYQGALSAAQVMTLYSNPGTTLDSPRCDVTAPTAGAAVDGDITMLFDGDDPQSSALTTTIEHSTDGGVTWSPSTPAGGSPTVNPDVARPVPFAGVTFVWDSVADGVGVATPQAALLRAITDDSCYRTPCSSASFDVDNSSLCGGTCGDCDQQPGAIIGILDALLAAQIAAGLVLPTPGQMGCCDVDASGSIGVLDALFIAQTAAMIPGVTLTCP